METAGRRVLVIGGGLAGLAAAQALAERGWMVTLLEARNRLGGRASSFLDSASGRLVDVCQHVSMGCCTEFARFCQTVGIAPLIRRQPVLHFMTPDRRVSRFQADPLPPPFHLARSFLAAHFLNLADKVRIATALRKLDAARQDDDPPFLDWLRRQRQTPQAIDRFWGLVLTSALNETPDRIGLRYARKVFRDGFLLDRRGFELDLPTVPLARLYGDELQAWFRQRQVDVRLNCGIKRFIVEGRRVAGVETRAGEVLQADWYISATPWDRLLDLLPAEAAAEPCFANLKNLETAPITSVHLWYRQPILRLANVVLVDCLGQWAFNRGIDGDDHYVQVVVSAARQFRGLGHDEVQRRITAELARLFPAAQAVSLRRARVVTEHAATFSPLPGVDRWRPAPQSSLSNLLLAGDWTATGWPATMEGAVRSGYQAAEHLLRHGR